MTRKEKVAYNQGVMDSVFKLYKMADAFQKSAIKFRTELGPSGMSLYRQYMSTKDHYANAAFHVEGLFKS